MEYYAINHHDGKYRTDATGTITENETGFPSIFFNYKTVVSIGGFVDGVMFSSLANHMRKTGCKGPGRIFEPLVTYT
jgi:hypothetical protein